jgi:hypothetical protein
MRFRGRLRGSVRLERRKHVPESDVTAKLVCFNSVAFANLRHRSRSAMYAVVDFDRCPTKKLGTNCDDYNQQFLGSWCS